MERRKYEHVQVVPPEIKAIRAGGTMHREAAQPCGRKDVYVAEQRWTDRKRMLSRQGASGEKGRGPACSTFPR